MDTQNIPPTPEQVQIASARWDFYGRLSAILALPALAFCAILIEMAWPALEWLTPRILFFFAGVFVLAVVGGLIGIGLHYYHMGKLERERYQHNTYRVEPDSMGNYPAIFDAQAKEFIQPAPGNYMQPVYQTYSPHYAPHITYHNEVEQLAGANETQPQLERAAPRLDDFYESIPYNSLQTGLGARLSNGELVTAGITESVHFKLLGSSGFGKSCLAASMLDIATTTNNPDVLRIALLDLEWKTARLFEQAPHVYEVRDHGRTLRMIGRDADEVALRLGTLKQELNRRAASGIETPVLLVYVEEMLSLKYEVDQKLQAQMLDDLNILALRGRKYGIFFLACMQVDYSSKELREAKGQFRTRAGFAIDTKAAQASGFVNTDLVKENFKRGKPGQYLLERPAFSELVLAPRYDVASKLTSKPTSKLTSSTPFFDGVVVESDVVTTAPVEPLDVTSRNLSVREQKVLELLRQEIGQTEIIKEIWNVGSRDGRPYREAVDEYRKIVAKIVAESE